MLRPTNIKLPLMRHLAAIMLLGLAATPSSTEAAILAYDGFASGGASPAAWQYRTSGGYSSDAIAYKDNPPAMTAGGQNPTTHGFQGAWTTPDNTASSVYLRALSSSLNYTDTNNVSLITTNGSATLFRSGLSANPLSKTYERDISIPGPLPSTLYFSVLVNFDANQPILFRTQTAGASAKPAFGFGIDANGFGFVSTNNATTGATLTSQTTATALTPGTTYLLVLKVQETVPLTMDVLTLYVNPLLGSEELNVAAASLTGDFFVAGQAGYELTNLFVTGVPNGSSTAPTTRGVTFDEFRISTAWSDIAAAIPEPTRLGMLAFAFGVVLLRRKRAAA